MDELEKLRVLLPHWIEHNQEHAVEFREWAAQAGEAGADIVAASEQMEAANRYLQAALDKLGETRPG
jgi:delta-aminolevulinic acid dehydratase/porphobilinogen synthase